MEIRKNLLSTIGLNEYAPLKSIFLAIIFLGAIGIFADGMVDLILESLKIPKIILAIVLFTFVYFIYNWLGKKELKLNEKLSERKIELIMFCPSNLELLEKTVLPHKLKKIFFIKTKEFPSQEEYKKMKEFLKSKEIILNDFIVDSKDNPRTLKDTFFRILSSISEKYNVVVNVTSGGVVASLVLNECANFFNIDVEYIGSEYDQNNNIIPGTSKSTIIDFSREFIK